MNLMPSIAPLTLWLSLVSALILTQPAAVLSQELSEAELTRREVLQEWIKVSNGRTDFEISDPASVPKFLARFAKQSGCVYEAEIDHHPIRFMRLKGARLSIIFCRAGIEGSHQVFDLTDLQKPKVLQFPFLAIPSGFGTTDSPGGIDYQRDKDVFQAERGSDTNPAVVRHVYRFDYLGFVVTRIELKKGYGAEWTTIWEAPPWSFPDQ
jgi:hypothetical protein